MFLVSAVVQDPVTSVVLVAGGSVLGWFLKKTFGDTKSLEAAAKTGASSVVREVKTKL